MKERKELVQYIQAIMDNRPVQPLEINRMEQRELAEAILALGSAILEAKDFANELANGQLNVLGNRYNPFIGPLKDLQSSLRHMIWQVRCISKGDYSQQVDFLGEFSDAFNIMIEQVKLREVYQRKSVEMEKNIIEQRNKMLAEQLKQQSDYYKSLDEIQQKLRVFRHDIKNHYICLDGLLKNDDIKGARKYLECMANVIASDEIIVNTGNTIFDALISEKIKSAKQKGIEVETKISINRELKVNNFDWCILFGNALDNAIEACMRIADKRLKKIWIKIISFGNVLNVLIKNTANEPIAKEEFYETSKENPMDHGMGLKSISDVVERYDGVLQTKFENGKFILTFMLCII